jgi:TonB family protein
MPAESNTDLRPQRRVGGLAGDFAARRTQRGFLALSLATHSLLLGWLLHAPQPTLLTPSSVALGKNGTSMTRLYWPSRVQDNGHGSSPDTATEVYQHQRLAHQRLTWKQNSSVAKLPPPPIPLLPSEIESKSKTSTISNLGHGAPAGLPYGTLGSASTFGDEIRPALPVTTSDPVVYPWERPDSEGNVVVEITIDERGEIVRKTVLESAGPALDNKVLSALENWHFHPATRNGVAIASKQDAIFHFKARG